MSGPRFLMLSIYHCFCLYLSFSLSLVALWHVISEADGAAALVPFDSISHCANLHAAVWPRPCSVSPQSCPLSAHEGCQSVSNLATCIFISVFTLKPPSEFSHSNPKTLLAYLCSLCVIQSCLLEMVFCWDGEVHIGHESLTQAVMYSTFYGFHRIEIWMCSEHLIPQITHKHIQTSDIQ